MRKDDIIEEKKERKRKKKMMIGKKSKQQKMEIVMLEELVPENHLLRKIDKVIDFSFINEICRPYYSEDK